PPDPRAATGSTMLNLASSTAPRWLERALAHLDEILLDHAHCEKKAASTAVSLLFRYPQHASLLAPLADLAREELAHFTLVLGHLNARGRALGRQVPSPYASELMRALRPDEPARAVDTLLCLSLIEARSCERMKLLADALGDAALRGLYAALLASEARHHQCYVDLAASLAPSAEVRGRLRELARHEAEVIARAPALARLHC
ncbi:MAG: tRNA-(ms[2]io[6]A)-hydroxylase, partial [Thermodesulfobacteriota bacterium]